MSSAPLINARFETRRVWSTKSRQPDRLSFLFGGDLSTGAPTYYQRPSSGPENVDSGPAAVENPSSWPENADSGPAAAENPSSWPENADSGPAAAENPSSGPENADSGPAAAENPSLMQTIKCLQFFVSRHYQYKHYGNA